MGAPGSRITMAEKGGGMRGGGSLNRSGDSSRRPRAEDGHLGGATVPCVNGSDGLKRHIATMSCRDSGGPPFEPLPPPLTAGVPVAALVVCQTQEGVVVAVWRRDQDVPGPEAYEENALQSRKLVRAKMFDRLHRHHCIEATFIIPDGGDAPLP